MRNKLAILFDLVKRGSFRFDALEETKTAQTAYVLHCCIMAYIYIYMERRRMLIDSLPLRTMARRVRACDIVNLSLGV